MTKLLKGAPVAEKIKEETIKIVQALPAPPTLAIVRLGETGDDLAYEKSIRRACAACGVNVVTAAMPAFTPQEILVRSVHQVALDPGVHGIIVMCPRQYDRTLIGAAIGGKKDVDGAAFLNGSGYPPCTPQAVMETLKFYGCEPKGKRAVVIGRSPVVGAPAAKLLEQAGAAVELCHSKTPNPEELCRSAEILVSAAGKKALVDKMRLTPGQIVIDVGINFDENGKICGDVDPKAAEIPAALSPVPGGIGAITPYLLALHTAKSASSPPSP